MATAYGGSASAAAGGNAEQFGVYVERLWVVQPLEAHDAPKEGDNMFTVITRHNRTGATCHDRSPISSILRGPAD